MDTVMGWRRRWGGGEGGGRLGHSHAVEEKKGWGQQWQTIMTIMPGTRYFDDSAMPFIFQVFKQRNAVLSLV